MKNLIFDIDGTLWNSTPVVAKGWTKACRESGVEGIKDMIITDKILQKEFGKPMDVIADDLFGEIDPAIKTSLLEKCCRYEHEYLMENTKDLAYEGMREVMHELAKNFRLFIVSNCQNGYIELVMDKNGLTDIIEDFECFGKTGLQKDENISLVINRNGLDAKETVYIGDTMGDYNATKKAGLEFVFARYGFGKVDNPDYVVDSFKELKDILCQ